MARRKTHYGWLLWFPFGLVIYWLYRQFKAGSASSASTAAGTAPGALPIPSHDSAVDFGDPDPRPYQGPTSIGQLFSIFNLEGNPFGFQGYLNRNPGLASLFAIKSAEAANLGAGVQACQLFGPNGCRPLPFQP